MFYFLNPPEGEKVYPYTLTDLRFANPGAKFPAEITDAIAAEYHCFPVQPTEPTKAPAGKKQVRDLPENVDGMFFERWKLVDLSAEETDAQWAAVRAERNQRLSACDWTQLADAPLTDAEKADWAEYRQALRDLPTTQTDPFDIVWPTAR